ncbi:MAG: LacI family DNA-binding transcriptional regulator [Planctomycetota bacterium]
MKTRSSIRDVATRAGVSHTTASLALRHDPRISAATRRKVELAARKLNYRPHAVVADLMAQLRTLKIVHDTSTLGFITAWPTRDGWEKSPNHRRFFAGVNARAHELGYKVEVFWLREPGMNSRRMSQILRARGIRGLILQSLPKAPGRLSLEWQHFAAVAKGLTIAQPRLHRVVSSHFEDMRLVSHHLKRLGYRRPGLVLDAAMDMRVDRAWLAAYLLQQRDTAERDRVPALILTSRQAATAFSAWLAHHRPDVILFTGLPVLDWVKRLALRVPKDVGLVHLDWSEEVGPLAGIDTCPEVIGEAAVDLLVGQLHAHEYGIPAREKIVAVHGRWIKGASLRRV